MSKLSLDELLIDSRKTFSCIGELPKHHITSDLEKEIQNWKAQITDACLALVTLELSDPLQSNSIGTLDNDYSIGPDAIPHYSPYHRKEQPKEINENTRIHRVVQEAITQLYNITSGAIRNMTLIAFESRSNLVSDHSLESDSIGTQDNDYSIDLRAISHCLPYYSKEEPKEIDENIRIHRLFDEAAINLHNICIRSLDNMKLIAFDSRSSLVSDNFFESDSMGIEDNDYFIDRDATSHYSPHHRDERPNKIDENTRIYRLFHKAAMDLRNICFTAVANVELIAFDSRSNLMSDHSLKSDSINIQEYEYSINPGATSHYSPYHRKEQPKEIDENTRIYKLFDEASMNLRNICFTAIANMKLIAFDSRSNLVSDNFFESDSIGIEDNDYSIDSDATSHYSPYHRKEQSKEINENTRIYRFFHEATMKIHNICIRSLDNMKLIAFDSRSNLVSDHSLESDSIGTQDNDYSIDLRAASHFLPRRLKGKPKEIDDITKTNRSLHESEIEHGNILCYKAMEDGKLVAFEPRSTSLAGKVLEVFSISSQLHYFSFPKLTQPVTSVYNIGYCAHPECGEQVQSEEDHLQLCQDHAKKLVDNIENRWLPAAAKNIYDGIKNVGEQNSKEIHHRIYLQLLPQLDAWIEQIDSIIPTDCTGTGVQTSSVDAWLVLQLRPMRQLLMLMKSAIFIYRMHLNPEPTTAIIAAIIALIVYALNSDKVKKTAINECVQMIHKICGILAAIFAYVGIGILYTLDLIFSDDAYIAIILKVVGGGLVIIGGVVTAIIATPTARIGGMCLATVGLTSLLIGHRMGKERDGRGAPHPNLIEVHLDLRLARERLWQWI